MYTAIINKKKFSGGKLTVEVIYTNGNENIIDTHEANQSQELSWLENIISRKLKDLNSLSDINDSIVIGPFSKWEQIESEKDIYYKKAIAYTRYMAIARNGFIKSDRPIIIELREWLINNFKDEYVDLF